MSLTGNIEGKGVDGVVAKLLELRGYSAYEIAVRNGFVGTVEEWLASLKADFDEEAAEAKSSISVYVDELIASVLNSVNENAKSAEDRALSNIESKEKESVSEIERLTENSKEILAAACSVPDAREVLIWENDDLECNARSYTVDIPEGEYDLFRIVVSALKGTIYQDCLLYTNEATSISMDLYNAGTISWGIHVGTSSISFSCQYNPAADVSIQPYKIYGIKNEKVDLLGANGAVCMKLLWENASLRSSFGDTRVTLANAAEYDAFAVMVCLRNDPAPTTLGGIVYRDRDENGKAVRGKIGCLTGTATAARSVWVNDVAGGVEFYFNQCTVVKPNDNQYITNDKQYCIPYQIYGIKGAVK